MLRWPRLWPRSEAEYLKQLGATPEEIERIAGRRKGQAQAKIVEKQLEEQERLTRMEASRIRRAGRKKPMNPRTKLNIRRAISMAVFCVAIYFAVAAYEPSFRARGASLSPGLVTAAVACVCVAYFLWPKRQG
jgi:hypothetical protein